jgi:pyruvate dehydrogenase E1 component alpha subunit
MAYIATGEVEAKVQSDPVPRFRGWLITEGHAAETELAAIDAQAVRDAEEAWEFANDSPYPDAAELYTDVFAPASGA